MYNSRIAGMGAYVPENVVTNDDLSKMMDTNDAWIQERTGIKERRHIKEGDGNTTAVMGVKAAKIAPNIAPNFVLLFGRNNIFPSNISNCSSESADF